MSKNRYVKECQKCKHWDNINANKWVQSALCEKIVENLYVYQTKEHEKVELSLDETVMRTHKYFNCREYEAK